MNRDNKKILVNTGVLYVRLIVTTIIGLVASRYILLALGADDYGLYSVVGGIVTFMNVIGTTMVSASYRFLAIEIGKGSEGNPNRIYNTCNVIHLLLAFLLVLVGETIGIFYVNNYLNVLPDKLNDALFVLHISLFTTALTVLNVPAHGLTIAREKFVFTSSIEILFAVAKLILVLWLMNYPGNRLRGFTVIMAVLTLFTFLSYQVYCWCTTKEVIKWRLNRRKSDYKEIFVFAWWSLFGALASVGTTQGSAMIINFFFGTVLNAAYGIAMQVNRYANLFVKSITQATIPQIMKSYGAGNTERSINLVYVISRISSLAMLLLLVPLLICTDDILVLWLKEPPEFTTIFVIFLVINTFVSVLGSGFNAAIQSTGNIKKNEVWVGCINLITLPIMFALYKIGMPPFINVVIVVIATIIIWLFQIGIMKQLTPFVFSKYLTGTLIPVFLTAIVFGVPLVFLHRLFGHTLWHVLSFLIITEVWGIFMILVFGINKREKNQIISFVKKRKKHE